MNSAMPILKRIIGYGAVLALGIAVVGGAVGFFVDGGRGVVSALLGTAIAFLFLAVTAGSILLGNSAAKSDFLSPIFFSTVLGGWILKFVLFLIIIVLLKDQPWINTTVLFLSIIAAVIGSLVVDVMVIARSRLPYVSDIALPGDTSDEGAAASS
ncbi:MAG: hypothetical protein ACOH1J_00870 [Microbacteriaceae bacterium]